jgi:hypothetical protein
MSLADKRGLLSRDHFSVDGTLIQAWASHKSFRRKDGPDDGPPAGGGRNADTDWKGERRSNDTHESSTDPHARLFKKSKKSPAILCYHGHILMENRSGLVVGAVVSYADGFAERASALRLLDCVPGAHAKTVGADKAYDTRDFVNDCRARNVTPHVARNDERWGGSAVDGRTSRHVGYRIGQVIRKRIAFRLGQDHRTDPADGLSRHQASRPALQADDGCEQSDPHGPNARGGAARSDAMSRHGAKTARDKGCMRAQAPRRFRGEPVIQRKIARASLLNIASVVMTRRFSTAC